VVGKYEYDGRGRRTVSHIDSAAPGEPDGTLDDFRHFFYNSGWQILETRMADAADASADTVKPEYQYVWSIRYIDAPVLRDENTDADDDCIDGSDERLYYTTDANMNVTALVNTSGTVVERYMYDPYGNVTTMDENWTVDTTPDYDNSILYCGYYYDAETGLYNVRRRVYHAQLGRWLQRDPIGYSDGQSLYTYVQATPTSEVDPLGLAVAPPLTPAWSPPAPPAIPSGTELSAFSPLHERIWELIEADATDRGYILDRSYVPDSKDSAGAVSWATGVLEPLASSYHKTSSRSALLVLLGANARTCIVKDCKLDRSSVKLVGRWSQNVLNEKVFSKYGPPSEQVYDGAMGNTPRDLVYQIFFYEYKMKPYHPEGDADCVKTCTECISGTYRTSTDSVRVHLKGSGERTYWVGRIDNPSARTLKDEHHPYAFIYAGEGL